MLRQGISEGRKGHLNCRHPCYCLGSSVLYLQSMCNHADAIPNVACCWKYIQTVLVAVQCSASFDGFSRGYHLE